MKNLRTGFTMSFISNDGKIKSCKVHKSDIYVFKSFNNRTIAYFRVENRLVPLNNFFVETLPGCTKNGSGRDVVDVVRELSASAKTIEIDLKVNAAAVDTWSKTSDSWMRKHMHRLLTKQFRNSIVDSFVNSMGNKIELLDRYNQNRELDRIVWNGLNGIFDQIQENVLKSAVWKINF